MKKLMEEALVRHFSDCETMGSASTICTDKTGTLTTTHMVVDKIWICGIFKSVKIKGTVNELKVVISRELASFLLQCIFLNSSSEAVKGKDGEITILGTLTKTALLEFGLDLEETIDSQHQNCTKLKVEPFNSVKNKMSVLVSLPGGGIRAFCKGACETVLQLCDKVLDSDGNSVPLSEKQTENIMDVINNLANEALRKLCLAFIDLDETYNGDVPSNGYTLIAVIDTKDPVCIGVKEAVQTCIATGIITVRMVTRDNINTSKAIARECGILTADGLAIEGLKSRTKRPQEMKELIARLQVMA